jgi:hypothetical protein
MELVVARYQEDLAWLKRVPREFAVTVYDKNPVEPWPGSMPLPNVGREAHTYFHHIVERYGSLAPLTVFCQGKPFDHAFDFRHKLRELATAPDSVRHFQWFGHIIDTDDSRGRLFISWSKNEDGRDLNLAGFHRELFGVEGPETYSFYLGAQFAVTRETILNRPKSFYERARELAISFPDGAHCLERMWDRVFGVQGVPEEWQGRTVYLKKIKRLER